MNHSRVVFHIHKEHQLFAKCGKCHFRLRSVTFHCHIISSQGIEVDLRNIEVVKNTPTPLNQTNISSFLGLSGYYWRFVEGFASISSPLTTLTQKCMKFEWSEAC